MFYGILINNNQDTLNGVAQDANNMLDVCVKSVHNNKLDITV